jgi:WD40 repeat protein
MGLSVLWRQQGVRRSLDVFPDGSGWVACTEGQRICAYGWDRKERWSSPKAPGDAVRVSGDGRYVVVGPGTSRGRSLAVLDAATGQLVRRLTMKGPSAFAAIPGTDRIVATTHPLTHWELTSGKGKVLNLVGEGEAPPLPFDYVACHPGKQGAQLAAAMRCLELWTTVLTGKSKLVARVLNPSMTRGHAETSPMRLAYSPDGKTLATISLDGVLELMDAKLDVIAKLQLPGDYWNAADIAWSTDGTLIAVCSPYSSVAVVSVGKRLKAVTTYRGGGSKVAFRPGQRQILVMREPAAVLLAL